VSRLDFSASYDLTKYLTLTADATNLLGRPLKVRETTYSLDGLSPAAFPRVVRYEESVYSAGIRFRF
jgi:outer membrane receptor protein involved in Fe transport